MRLAILLSTLALAVSATAATTTTKFNFENAEIMDVIKSYMTLTGQKFVIDVSVTRGKTSIYVPSEVTVEEAFNLLSEALAQNGLAIIDNGGTMTITQARNAIKAMIPTVTKITSVKPERMVNYIHQTKHINAAELEKYIRVLVSRDGTMMSPTTNQIVISDWISNCEKMRQVIEQFDRPGTKFRVAKQEVAPKREKEKSSDD